MAPSLAPNAHSASIQGPDGDIRIYTQIRNGAIVEWSGTGPLAFGTTHTSRVIVPPGVARIGTPLAATYWGGTKNGNFCEVSVCSPSTLLVPGFSLLV